MALDLEQKQLLSKARLLGSGTALPIALSNSEITKIIAFIFADLGRHDLVPDNIQPPPSGWDYYVVPLSWFANDDIAVDFMGLYEMALSDVPDFQTYFKCMCELHKRRRKYELILKAQPLPNAVQIAPRALLEFGGLPTACLASWLTWRKWFYDVDNRAAQETGYLFEPILTNALGGTAFGSKNSPVRRRSDNRKGRQVDCVLGTDAYEFKLRVTIAASGQGRFGEELDFAQDCLASGFRPVLLVLDPTPSHRLDDLSAAFRAVGGEAFTGNSAWEHIEAISGPTMATFVEKYVRQPIAEIDVNMVELLDFHISAGEDRREFSITFGDHDTWVIGRREDDALASDGSGDTE